MKRTVGISTFAIAAVIASTGTALAADIVTYEPQPQIEQIRERQNPWQIRVRALGVVPTNKGGVKKLNYDRIDHAGLKYSNSITPELDITYYFTNNFAAELILGTTKSYIDAKGKTLKDLGLKGLGSTWILPPTLTLQYHFTNFGAFKPYIGAGVNYTVFYEQKGSALDKLDIENTWGAAAQIGFDYMFDKHWGINFDVKKLWLRPDFTAKLGDAHLSGKAKLDPWLIGTGITYRF